MQLTPNTQMARETLLQHDMVLGKLAQDKAAIMVAMVEVNEAVKATIAEEDTATVGTEDAITQTNIQSHLTMDSASSITQVIDS
eukprot:CAMPEP_0202462338 /NCGR_PEP_ID=MMETSP1360-20130828/53568_1 /ASSEMBLY_ACC=CAM_ASM_000848 /TAXON_ID=515479 /ORGANISM="Licmophora paradoxa, Strain CCMP2313" /LENGTH=83 /DNA_ID=CAMNT_0049084769 /DNA_START=17 /DNA_END=264 /DNA_ORIENTATION=+